MSRPPLDAESKSSRIFILVPGVLYKATEADRENGRLSQRIRRFLEIIYTNGGATDSIHLRRTEILADRMRLDAELASLQTQEEAIHESQAQENHIHRAEETFRTHVKAAAGQPNIRWQSWLSPSRSDVKPLGMKRAKAILKEETGVEL